MRRLFLSITAVSIISTAAGCVIHTAGACDCTDLPVWARARVAPAAAKAEAIKEMPKEAPAAKDKEEAPAPKEKAEADPAEPPAGQ
jgi:hypothetical protein